MARDSEFVTKILEWRTPETWSSFGDGWSYRDRINWRNRLAHDLKAELLDRIQRVPGARLCDALDGTTRAIVSARAEVWEQLTGGDHPVIPQDVVTVHDDEEIRLA